MKLLSKKILNVNCYLIYDSLNGKINEKHFGTKPCWQQKKKRTKDFNVRYINFFFIFLLKVVQKEKGNNIKNKISYSLPREVHVHKDESKTKKKSTKRKYLN